MASLALHISQTLEVSDLFLVEDVGFMVRGSGIGL